MSISACSTRQRVLDAAGEVFAEHGFKETTVRQICECAGVNVAAVNYHFRDKASLYLEVIQSAYQQALEQYPTDALLSSAEPPAQKLLAFIHQLLRRLLDQGRPAWHGKLMSLEMVRPTGAIEQMVSGAIRPTFEALCGIVKEVIGPAAAEETVRRAALSVLGQCLLYHHGREVISRIMPGLEYTPVVIEDLARQIHRFSLAGLGALREQT